jgi:hypothetical protein
MHQLAAMHPNRIARAWLDGSARSRLGAGGLLSIDAAFITFFGAEIIFMESRSAVYPFKGMGSNQIRYESVPANMRAATKTPSPSGKGFLPYL